MNVTDEGMKVLGLLEVPTPADSGRSGPQVIYRQRDDKFVCGACGDALSKHERRREPDKAWMCTACGQVYVESCLQKSREIGYARTVCIGSGCSAARKKSPLTSVLRKMGTW